MIFRKSDLQKEIVRLVNGETDLASGFLKESVPVSSKAEAKSICSALDTIYERRNDSTQETRHILYSLAAYFQHVDDEGAFEVLIRDGLPRLRTWVRDLTGGSDIDPTPVLFILKILALHRQHEDVEFIAQAALKPVAEDEYMWLIIFGCFDAEHPFLVEMINALRDPLPYGLISIGYLDMANAAALAGKIESHPFDTQAGRNKLELWLSDKDEDNFSYAQSATAALPFLETTAREQLLKIAALHPDSTVRMESAWAQAKTGDENGLDRLAEFCLIPVHSSAARDYLEELGHAERIPSRARETNFQALAEMAKWLAFPTEFGRPPDEIQMFDTREIFWPPTNDRPRVFLIRYTYFSEDDGESDQGIGMVGSDTFAMFGETSLEMSAEDIYGVHCCWELEMNRDPRTPPHRTAEAGRAILAKTNDGFA